MNGMGSFSGNEARAAPLHISYTKTKYTTINGVCVLIYAGMAELADAHGSGPCESNFMQVQVLLPAPNRKGSL